MKANEAPERIYLLPRQGGDYAPYWRTDSQDGFGIEYTRTDAFIEKALEFFREHFCEYIDVKNANCDTFINIDGDKLEETFRNHMKGE